MKGTLVTYEKKLKFILSITLGLILSSGVVLAAGVVNRKQVSYTDNANLNAANIQEAIDNLMKKIDNCPDGYKCIKKSNAVSFSVDSWETIADAVESGIYPYKVGDTKEVNMGEIGKHIVRVANVTECENDKVEQSAYNNGTN